MRRTSRARMRSLIRCSVACAAMADRSCANGLLPTGLLADDRSRGPTWAALVPPVRASTRTHLLREGRWPGGTVPPWWRCRPLGVGLCVARLAAVSDEATEAAASGEEAEDANLTETRQQVEEQLAEARQRLADVPADVVVT